ncbi:rifin, partial [Plasmodium reichenowi]
GCGLGSVAGSVGLFGGIIINIWKNVALDVGIKEAIKAAAAEISAAGIEAGETTGKQLVIAGLQSTFHVQNIAGKSFESFFTTSYKNITSITQAVKKLHFEKCAYDSSGKLLHFAGGNRDIPICQSVWEQTQAVSQRGQYISEMEGIKTAVQNIVTKAEEPANAAAKAAEAAQKAIIKKAQETAIEATSTQLYSAIGYSILAILIIVLIMIIIYLVLRYRRKKKMKKKAQYTKLLNE